MALKAGTVSNFENSMAEAMETALKAEWAAVKGIPFPDAGEEDRRLLFVAIAQGLVRYLKDNAETSIIVHSVDVTQESGNDIQSTGYTGPPSSGTLHTHPVNLTQSSGAGNRVQSAGDGQVRIETTGELY